MPPEVGIPAPPMLSLDIISAGRSWYPELAEAPSLFWVLYCPLCPLYDSQKFCLQGVNWCLEGGLPLLLAVRGSETEKGSIWSLQQEGPVTVL